ncbi:MAG: hypothetical protein Q3979_01270 [Actinomycetaceae bacterium]|nr:hypothetical protein [Actinomycetaceae bacterium]
MPTVLKLVMRSPSEPDDGKVTTIDIYDLPGRDLADYRGLIVTMGCDQVFLHERRDELSAWVRSGGRMLVSGHPLRPFVDGMPTIRKMEFHGAGDVWLSPLGEHPIWAGVDRRDVLFNTGVPGQHSFEELTRIGVAGFYARNYLADLPEGAIEITGIGPGKLPVDVAYPLGSGEVIVHAGNDLLGFDRPGTTAERLSQTAVSYLAGDV